MKANSLVTFFTKMMFILSVVFLPACQKEVSEDVVLEPNAETQQAIKKVSAWLEDKRSIASPEKILIIEAVKSNLDFKSIQIEKLSALENLIIVPIKNSFKSTVNNNKQHLTNLLLIINPQGKIRKGNIVQFTPKQGELLSNLPKNTFHNFYNATHLVCDGSFTFINMSDKVLYELEYNDGKLTAYSQKQNTSDTGATNSTGLTTPTNCTDWYWVETYYNPDGSSTTTSQYLYTTCNNTDEYVEPECTTNCPVYNPEEDVETVMSPTQVDWYVCNYDNYTVPNPTGEWWELFSTERLYGTKKASLPGGGKFTKIEHLGETITGQSVFTWHKTGVTVAYAQLTARSTISGTVKKNGTVRANVQSLYHDFAFSSVFP